MHLSVRVGARDSKLSRVQVEEVLKELSLFHPHVIFDPVWIKTTGDYDQITSLRTLEKTNFFTKELDEKLLRGEIEIAIHSAKDLPEPLCEGLSLIALTKGVNPSDALVFNADELPLGAKIGTSSQRREEALLKWRSDLRCVDIRGAVDERLALLDRGVLDGLVVAEAALIRLNLTHRKRILLEGGTTPLQGRLAVLAKEGNVKMKELFAVFDYIAEVIIQR